MRRACRCGMVGAHAPTCRVIAAAIWLCDRFPGLDFTGWVDQLLEALASSMDGDETMLVVADGVVTTATADEVRHWSHDRVRREIWGVL